MKDWIPPATAAEAAPVAEPSFAPAPAASNGQDVVFLGFGGYLPDRVVTNAEIIREFPGVTEDYVYSVTGIRERRWAADDEKPSDMAYAAALDALRRARIPTRDIDAIILATTTPDVAMPSTRLHSSGSPGTGQRLCLRLKCRLLGLAVCGHGGPFPESLPEPPVPCSPWVWTSSPGCSTCQTRARVSFLATARAPPFSPPVIPVIASATPCSVPTPAG